MPSLNLQLGTSTLSLQSLQEGNDIYFDCQIDANPPAAHALVWRLNGQPLRPTAGVIQSNQSLVLQRVNRAQSGSYQCEAANAHGSALSKTIQLNIRYAPVCRTGNV